MTDICSCYHFIPFIIIKSILDFQLDPKCFTANLYKKISE